MKFCWKKFPRQDRLCGKKSRYGSRLALREKKFLRIQKTQELFPGQSNPLARDPETQATGQEAAVEPEPQAVFKQKASQSPKQSSNKKQPEIQATGQEAAVEPEP